MYVHGDPSNVVRCTITDRAMITITGLKLTRTRVKLTRRRFDQEQS